MGLFGRVSRGFQNAFSSPQSALLNAATLGNYSLINENKKAAATTATGAAVGFAVGGPAGAVVGGVTGAIKGGTDKRSILDSVAQTAVWSAAIVGGPVALTAGAAKVASMKAAFLAGNKAAAAKALAPAAAKSGGFMSTLKTAGLVSALSKFGQQAGGFVGLIPAGAQQQGAEQIWADGRRDILTAGNERADSEPMAYAAPSGPSPWLLLLPAGLVVFGVAWYLKKKKK